jgi:hypothetical protein
MAKRSLTTSRPTQLTSFIITLLLVLLGLSFLTGLGLWYVHEQREKLADLPRWTSFCQTTHGLLNPIICGLFGFLWFNHVRGGWKMRVNRKSGSTMTALMIVLIATGVGLYYGEARQVWFTIHLVAGLVIVGALPMHWIVARRWVRSIESGSATKTAEQGSIVGTNG